MLDQELWQAALGEIELNISRANFITWFRNTQIIANKDGLITVAVPSGFSKEWLQNKYNKLILRSLRNLSPDVKDLAFIITQNNQPGQNKRPKTAPAVKRARPEPPEQTKQPFQELLVNQETNLNPKYTFDNFVVGSFNELAQAAARAVINSIGTVYNPLFIYGGVGLGKTHLLQAVGNAVAKQYSDKKIKYISSEKFISELVDALHNGQMEQFKEAYRRIDVLIVDDVQLLAGKEKTQEEFFHTFNALYQKNKQIILSSDRPPKAIATLEERLRSRFEGGMIADISFPDFETRLAILRTKTEEKKLTLSEEAQNYIATHFQKNIREMEGALNRVSAAAKPNCSPDLSEVQKILSNIISAPRKMTSHKNVLLAVAEFYDIGLNDLTSRGRKKEIVYPRQIAMFLLREELKSSFPFIGERMGGRDHTTVMYACEKIGKEIENSELLQQEISLIRERIYNR